MLITLEGEAAEVAAVAGRIRARSEMGEDTPIVIFCGEKLKDGDSAVKDGIYFSCPDDFNQMREFIARLLYRIHAATRI